VSRCLGPSKKLRDMSSLPWCIIGDFNDFLSQQDKLVIHAHQNWLCNGFHEAINDCDLYDIKLEGHMFTWIKSPSTTRVMEERLGQEKVNYSML